MKRSFLTILGLILLLCICSASLVSCGDRTESAYDIAVKNGFVGSEADWLASLKGEDLQIYDIYENAKKEGFEGDFLAFLSEYLGLDTEDVAGAILAHEAKDISELIAYPLLASVSIQASSNGLSGTNSKPAAGSGVIYSLDRAKGDAYIITNHHVISYTDSNSEKQIHQSISVFLWGAEYTTANINRAVYVGGSETYDIAVLKVASSQLIQESNALPISVANSDEIAMGQTSIAIGNAAGQGISVTTGAISMDSKDVTLNGNRTQRLIQIEAPLNEGNSGGGLFDKNGKLIGIVSSKAESSSIENIGYAIPSNVAIGIVEKLIDDYEEGGSDSSVSLMVAKLGIHLETGNTFGVYDDEKGLALIREVVTIDSVTMLSPAKSAGLKSGDVLKSITVDDVTREIVRGFTLEDAELLCRENSRVTIVYERDGETLSVSFHVTSSCFKHIS